MVAIRISFKLFLTGTINFTLQLLYGLNVLLDPIYIYYFDLGVAGAAIATVISQAVSTLVYLCYVFQGKSVFHFRRKDCRFTKEILSEILKIGIPTLLFQLLTNFSIAMTNEAATEYGGSAFAAMGPVTKMMSMGSLAVFGFLRGFQPIAGFSYGSGNYKRLREAIRTAVIFLVMGKAKEGCILGACRQGICFLPAICFLPKVLGLRGVLYAQPVADVLAAVVTVFMAWKLYSSLLDS